MNFDAIADNAPQYLAGAWTTVQLLFIALVGGLVFAVPFAVLRTLPSSWAWRPVWLFTYVIRGTPLLVQLFLIYYGLAQFAWVRESIAWPWLSSAWFCACLAFAINTCAYTTEIIAGAIRTTPPGEVEAARAMGMSRSTLFRRILLPSAARRAIPAYGNEVILMLQGTSLASVVTLLDLTGVARDVNSRFFVPFEAFIAAAVLYLAITLVLVGVFHLAERRWLAHLRPRT